MSSHAHPPASNAPPLVSEARRNSRRTRLLPANSRENSDHSKSSTGHSGHSSINTTSTGGLPSSLKAAGAGAGAGDAANGGEEPIMVSLNTLRNALDEAEKEEKEQERKLQLQAKKQETEDDSDDDDTTWRKLMGDDIVMKILGSTPPLNKKKIQQVQPQDTVLMNYTARPAKDRKDTKGPVVQQAEGFLVTIGDGDVIPAIEMAARFMDAGQTVRVWAHSKYAMGPGIRSFTVEGSDVVQTIPPHTDMMYEITVTQIVVDTSRLNPYFPIQKALTKKKIANDIFQHEWLSRKARGVTSKVEEESTSTIAVNGDAPSSENSEDALKAADCTVAMRRAIRLYEKAAADMEGLLKGVYFAQVDEDHPQRQQARQIMLDTLNNSVVVHLLRLHDYHKAKQSAVRVLEQDPKNLKALLRAAKACLLDPASTLEEAKAAIDAAEEEVTNDNVNEAKELRRIKAQFKQQQIEYKNKSKAMFANVLKNPKQKSDPKVTSGGGSENIEDAEKLPFWQTRTFGVGVQLVIPVVFFLVFLTLKGNGIASEIRKVVNINEDSEF